ncbi:MAG: hypothetical protein WDW36_005775 [Sanguina aurantia]
MPAEIAGSSFQQHFHNGPNQAGNKSMLTYRPDKGIPGYTGFIPSAVGLPLPTKGSTLHTGKQATVESYDLHTKGAVRDPRRGSEYVEQYLLRPSQTTPLSKTGGGYWLAQQAGSPSPPFAGATTYRTEMLTGADNTAHQLKQSQNLSCTIVGYEGARRQQQQAALSLTRAATADPGSRYTLNDRPAPAVTSFNALVGYQTTYGGTIGRSQRLVDSTKGGAGIQRPSTTQGEDRRVGMPRVMQPSMADSHTTYKQEYGEESSDPVARSAGSQRQQTRGATTRDLAAGTTRLVSQLPGYTGRVPGSIYNQKGLAQADRTGPRVCAKSQMMLFTLDQYGRSRVPHYTGHRPRAFKNITTEQLSHGPSDASTYGAANAATTAFGVPAGDHSNYINSRTGLMTFFSSTGPYISDNGLANAQQYYKMEPGGREV